MGILKNPPKPFTTSLLQQKSSNELNYSPKQTMRLAQTLYENGWITYMRTDCGKYSKEFIKSAKKYVNDKFGKNYINKKIDSLTITKIKTKKNNAQEAHEAIRPTDVNRCPHNCKEEGKITSKEIRLYKMIWNNTMESLMSEAKYNKLTSTITAPNGKKYKRNEENVVFPGRKVVQGYEKINPNYKLLKLETDMNKIYKYVEINSVMKLKELKGHYSEAKLVQILEEKGIGRPSTFSALIEKIQERNYVEKIDIEGEKVKISKEFKNVLLCNRTNVVFPPTSHNLFHNAIDYHLIKNKISENILISAHGNSIRALCKYLFNLDNNEISKLEIPTGNPLLIELENSKISNCKYLDQERAKDLLVF